MSLRRATVLLAVLALGAAVAGGARGATLPSGFAETTVWSGLTNPTALRFAPDGRVFVAEKSGRINVYDGLTDTTPTLFADLSTNVYNYWDRGLVGLALDPAFPTRPYVYVLYTHDAAIGGLAPRWGTPGVLSDPCPSPPGPTTGGCVGSARLSRLEAAGNVMTGPERVLIEDWCQQYPSHTVGTVAFGSDGALYVSGGDAASFTFADYGQSGSPPNMCGDPPVPAGGTQTPPTAEGGSLRSQDLRTGGDPLGLDGTLLRLDPDTGQGLPDNPRAFSADPNERRVLAYGFRNPFRFAVRPGTSELWVGDVGWDTVEELDVVPPAVGTALNFGWPCYEGSGRQAGYDAANLSLCESLYAEGTAAVRGPYFAYRHDEKVVAGESCPAGGSSVSGVAFRGGGAYPSLYDGALFLADYTRRCIWALPRGSDGLPDPAARVTFAAAAAGPVDLQIGPGGDLFYADFDGGTIRRVSYEAPAGEDKALGRPATASSVEKAGLEPQNGNDGNSTTRWSSHFADDQWWQVDLGSPRNVDRVTINWEIAHASHYQILTSTNGTTFTLAAEQTLTTPTTQTTTFTTRTARYLRIHCTTRATSYGCSFWDANIYGPSDGAPPDTTPPTAAITAPASGATVSGTTTVAATAADDTGVAGVQFRLDGATLGPEDTTAPYAASWNTAGTTNGAHTLTATARDMSGNTATSAAVGVTVANTGPEDKALGRPATASSVEKAGLEPQNGNDGNSTTRWSSHFADDQWWQVDLGSPRNVDRVTINWEIAHASHYQILTSTNGTTFTLAAEQTLTTPTTQTTTFTTRTARYLRIHCTTRATSYGCSFWDANVHGPSDTSPPPANTPPAATFQAPPATRTWAVGETIDFAATATDQEDGPLPASAFSFSLLVRHCPSTCHSHVAQTFDGVRSGTFSAPDHDYPSHLELRLTVTDSGGLTDVETVELQPRTAVLSFTSSPSGLQLVVGSQSQATPFTHTAIVGSSTSIAAPSPQTLGGATYGFGSWSDGGAATHNVVTPAAGATFDAFFEVVAAPSLVAAYGLEETSGTVVTDSGTYGNAGTLHGATRTSAGRFGRALSFDGTNDYVVIADAASLDLAAGMTLEAWVYPTALGQRARPVLFKAPADPVYDLHAGLAGRPAARVLVGAREEAAGTGALPLGTWTHLAATYDGATLTLWVNGTPVGARPVTGSIRGSAAALRLGGSAARDWFRGRIDEVRIYNRALSAEELATDMQTPVRP